MISVPDDPPPGESFKHLHPGHWYVVIAAFTDFDGVLHPRDESWMFLDKDYAPYDAGLSLFVSPDNEQRLQIRLQWYPEAQGPIIDHLESYIRAME